MVDNPRGEAPVHGVNFDLAMRDDKPIGPGQEHDDGHGFDTAGAGGGQGLVTMAERAAIIPGVLTVQSAPGNGTEVKLVIP